MKKLTLTLVAIALPISAATISQFPEPVAAVVPILNAPAASGELAFTNFPDECALKFHGRDLIFTLPCAQVWDVRHAGFREKWLSIGITSGSFATQYGFLLQTAPEPGARHRLDIALPRDASLESAEDFAQALEARLNKPHPQTVERSKARILFQAPAMYFAKKPGGIIATEGLNGGLVCSDTGFAFEFASVDHLSAERKAVIKNSSFAIPAAAVQDANISVERPRGVTSRPTVLVHVRLRADSPAFDEYHPLLTADNELLFRIDWVESSDRVRAYF